VTLHWTGHETMGEHLPAAWRGRVGVVMFNLGYLPGAGQALVTRPVTTRAALVRAVELLRPGGLLSVLAYTGHAGGRHEAAVVAAWCRARRRDGWRLERARGPGRESPRWLGLYRPG
jgi:hypothetical protein